MCQDKRLRGEKHPNWKGGKIINNEGYVYILSNNHPYKNKGNRVAEHRLVMEKHLGRYLTKKEDVHHINGIKTDNRIENLELFSHSFHGKFEKLNGNPYKWSRNWNECKICRKKDDKNHKHNAHGLCKICYNRLLLQNNFRKEGYQYV